MVVVRTKGGEIVAMLQIKVIRFLMQRPINLALSTPRRGPLKESACTPNKDNIGIVALHLSSTQRTEAFEKDSQEQKCLHPARLLRAGSHELANPRRYAHAGGSPPLWSPPYHTNACEAAENKCACIPRSNELQGASLPFLPEPALRSRTPCDRH